jgi:hypothetical protein
MAFTWKTSTGEMVDDYDNVIGCGYSGNGSALNNPAAEGIVGHGPIPQGAWTIGAFETYPHLGTFVAPLTPAPDNDMDGREGGFFIHGDNSFANHTASDGCIVLNYDARVKMSMSNDRQLIVVP